VIEAIWVHGIMPTEYYQRRVFRGNALADKSLYLRDREVSTLLAAIDQGADVARLDHLCRFAAECREGGLPVVRLVAAFTGGSTVLLKAGEAEELPPRDLLLRPEKRIPGETGQLWRWREQDRTWTHEHMQLSAASLLQLGNTHSPREPGVLHEAVHDHPEMARFTAGGFASVDAAGGPVPLFATLRLRSVTPGGRLGGVLTAGVDLETGALSPAWSDSMADGEFESHPDSGSVIAGAVVPQWRSLLALALAAHLRFRDVPFGSWEIAWSGAGPVLLEASSHFEASGHVLLAETPFVELCLHRLDRLRREALGMAVRPVAPQGGSCERPLAAGLEGAAIPRARG
jgi:hypothetical protein